MLTANEYLSLVSQRGQAGKPLKRVYANMLKLEHFTAAYGKLYSNKGAMTAGADGETVDGTSIEKLEKLIEELKTRQFRWTPVVRTYIPKKDGRERPLGIPTWKDKVVQEVIRAILEAYYEPQFSDLSHGFRPKRGCHTALGQMYLHWKGVKWYIEGDIQSFFNNIDHDVLLEIIGRKIKDKSLLNLLYELLKAGYLEQQTRHETFSGTPQGGILSPLLANIYLNELDKMIETELIPEFNTNKKYRRQNKEYNRISSRTLRTRKAGKHQLAKELAAKRRRLPSGDPNDPEFKRLWYVRYADDWLIGYIGPISEAKVIRARVKEFLEQRLKLKLNLDKTYITQASREKARFLGFDVWCPVPKDRTKPQETRLEIPNDVITQWLQFYSRNGKPYPRFELTSTTDYEIVAAYGARLRGLYNYYRIAHNVYKLGRVKYRMEVSLVQTLAAKHKTKTRTIYRKYHYKDDTKGIQVIDRGMKATFGGFSMGRHKEFAYVSDIVPLRNYKRTEVVQRLITDICEIEGCTGKAVEAHHINSLKNLKKRWSGRKEKPIWVKAMIARHRKTLMVCKRHHILIHSGKYDKTKLK